MTGTTSRFLVAAARKSRYSCSCFSSTSSSSSTTISPRVETTIDSKTGICHVVLNRPDKHNALDLKMIHAIVDTANELRLDKSLRAVILSGKGKSFCSGLDVASVLTPNKANGFNPMATLSTLLERNPSTRAANLVQDVAFAWRRLDVPVLAVLHGHVYGGGLQLALGADVRIAAPCARLSVMETKWGLIPDMGASVTLRELVRMDVAKELTLTGRVVAADEALQLGLVTRVVVEEINDNNDDDEHEKEKKKNGNHTRALAEAQTLALQIAERSPDAVRAAKYLFQETWVSSEQACLERETFYQKQLLASWNQLAASARSVWGYKLPYKQQKNMQNDKNDERREE